MALKLYLDEDVDPLLAPVLRNRGIDCLSTREAGNLGISDADQLAFAASQERVLLTFNVKDFVRLARNYAERGRPHTGIIVSNHIPFQKLLRRILLLFKEHAREDLRDKLLWLQDYEKRPDLS
jgi:predicted nuclease of predicted toxin-antitoxin system